MVRFSAIHSTRKGYHGDIFPEISSFAGPKWLTRHPKFHNQDCDIWGIGLQAGLQAGNCYATAYFLARQPRHGDEKAVTIFGDGNGFRILCILPVAPGTQNWSAIPSFFRRKTVLSPFWPPFFPDVLRSAEMCRFPGAGRHRFGNGYCPTRQRLSRLLHTQLWRIAAMWKSRNGKFVGSRFRFGDVSPRFGRGSSAGTLGRHWSGRGPTRFGHRHV